MIRLHISSVPVLHFTRGNLVYMTMMTYASFFLPADSHSSQHYSSYCLSHAQSCCARSSFVDVSNEYTKSRSPLGYCHQMLATRGEEASASNQSYGIWDWSPSLMKSGLLGTTYQYVIQFQIFSISTPREDHFDRDRGSAVQMRYIPC